MRAGWRVLAVLAAIVLLHGALPMHASTSAAGSRLLLPDLRMAKPTDVRLVRVGGRRLVRFTTIIVNEGRGPMDAVGRRTCRSIRRCPRMTVRQRIQRANGSWVVRRTDARMQYEVGDGHRHWHLVDFEQYRLFRLGTADATPRAGAKFGFCFFDVRRIRPFARRARGYLESGCGTPSSTRVHVGLSGGWGDIYPWDFAGQYVDVTGLTRGEYLLCVTADPAKSFRQSNTRNDQAWVRLRIGRTGVVVRETRVGSCAAERKRWAPPATAADAVLRGVETRMSPTAVPARVADLPAQDASAAFLCRIGG
jgi:hypothetical protein